MFQVQTVSSRLLSDSGDPPYPVDDLNATDIDDGENGRISFSLEGNFACKFYLTIRKILWN